MAPAKQLNRDLSLDQKFTDTPPYLSARPTSPHTSLRRSHDHFLSLADPFSDSIRSPLFPLRCRSAVSCPQDQCHVKRGCHASERFSRAHRRRSSFGPPQL